VSKIHLIFRDKSGENLERKDQIKLEYAEKDEYTHLYTLVLKANGTYKVVCLH
jgi:calreticulin